MSRPGTLLIASGNRNKIKELEQLLRPLEIRLVSTLDYPEMEEVVEDQETLEGNALKKAREWHARTGLAALADDTGLEVEALGGAPGVHSARYAGPDAGDSDNVAKLLKAMEGESNRSARFRTVVALVGEEGEHQLFEGVCEGDILSAPTGDHGFGYDPVFRSSGYSRSFAELTGEEKNRISHRGLAMKRVLHRLREL